MNLQEILVFIVFAGAAVYIGRSLFRTLSAKKSCESGCGKCAAKFPEVPAGK